MRVAVDAQAPADWLPDMEHIAAKINQLTDNKGFNPAWGTTDVGMCSYLYRWYVDQRHRENYWVPIRNKTETGYFGVGLGVRYLPTPMRGTSQQTLWNEIVRHVGKNYAVVTGTRTLYLKKWSVTTAQHINAILGYDADLQNGWYPVTMHQVQYAETAGSQAGYQGTEFKIWWPRDNFWKAVYNNNVQCMLKAGI